jgi:hypothetical protein
MLHFRRFQSNHLHPFLDLLNNRRDLLLRKSMMNMLGAIHVPSFGVDGAHARACGASGGRDIWMGTPGWRPGVTDWEELTAEAVSPAGGEHICGIGVGGVFGGEGL